MRTDRNYKLTVRKLTVQLPVSDGFVTEYVPLTFSEAVVAPCTIELGGNASVTTAVAPGARFATGGGVDNSDPEPKAVPVTVTCSELTVTLPVFVTVTCAT